MTAQEKSVTDFQPVDPSTVPRFADIATFMRMVRHPVAAEVDVGLAGGITCITVANLMFEMLCVIADSVASRR